MTWIINPYRFGVPPATAWNPSDKDAALSLSNSNRTVTNTTASHRMVRGVSGKTTGQFYYELTFVNDDAAFGSYLVGVAQAGHTLASFVGSASTGKSWQSTPASPLKFSGGSAGGYGAQCDLGDVIGIAVDLTTGPLGTITFYKNNSTQGVAFSNLALTGTVWYPAVSVFASPNPAAVTANFASADWVYSPPAGHGEWN